MRRSSQRLADGREIIFFDRAGAPTRIVDDQRPITALTTHSELRRDPMLDEFVVIASHRQDRTYLPPADECPLCPSSDGRHTEVPTPDYQVVAFENRFPSLSGYGRCEVLCFSSEHTARFADLTSDRVALVLAAWIDRTVGLSKLASVQQVFCFENRGREIGVTLPHPHGQIYGYPFVTPRTARMLAAAGRHRETTGRNLFADVLSAELAAGDRVVARSRHWTAFVPFAARWPVEVHLYPDIQVARLPALAEEARYDFADLYLEVLHRLEAVHGTDLPYISAWHQAPVRAGEDLGLHLEVSSPRRAPGKLKFLAGSESAMGAFINDIAPEAAARALREAFSQP